MDSLTREVVMHELAAIAAEIIDADPVGDYFVAVELFRDIQRNPSHKVVYRRLSHILQTAIAFDSVEAAGTATAASEQGPQD